MGVMVSTPRLPPEPPAPPPPVFDIGNASYDGVSFSFRPVTNAAAQIYFSPDGTHMMVMGLNWVGSPAMTMWGYDLSPAWDITSATLASSYDTRLDNSNSPTALTFSPDGTRMYVAYQASPQIVRQYSLSPAWDLDTATIGAAGSISGETSNPVSLAFKADGTVLYVMSTSDQRVYQYDLSPAWDITTISVNGSLPIGGVSTGQYGMTVEQNGEKLFTGTITDDIVYQFTMSSAYDITSGTYDSKSFDVSFEETALRSMAFKPDGTKMYVVGTAADTVFQYSLN